MYKVEIEQFSGPLDLLLQLIQKQEFDVSKLALAHITDAYIQLLSKSNLGPEELSDFLVIASKLLYIKSKILLPNVVIEEEDTGIDLETQLKMYAQYFEVIKKVEEIVKKRYTAYTRNVDTKKILQSEQRFYPPEGLTKDMMHDMYGNVVSRLSPIIALPKARLKKIVSIKEKIADIQSKIMKKACVHFGSLAVEAKDKTELMITTYSNATPQRLAYAACQS